MAKMNRALQVRKIREDLVRAGYDPEKVDVDALVDSTLTYRENRANVAEQLRYKNAKKASARAQMKRADEGWCETLRDQCERKGDTDSCRMYGRDKCSSVTGKIEGCRTCNSGRPGRQKKAKKSNARMVDGKCMIPVKAHMRRCPPNMTMKAARGR